MHPNPAYRGVNAETNLTFAAQRGFGLLTLNGAEGPLAAHVPFLIAQDRQSLDLHLVRSNPIARAMSGPTPALIAVSGPDAYISPDWYGLDHQVPTWNYVAVHLRGHLAPLPDSAMHDMLDRLSTRFEKDLAPKPIWTTDKMPDEVMAKLLRQIVPFRMTIEQVEGTWKLGQNKPEAARLAAADGVAQQGHGALAGLMRNPPG